MTEDQASKSEAVEKARDAWDDFQEFRQNKKVEIYYLRAQIENERYDIEHLLKSQRKARNFHQKAITRLEQEIQAIDLEIEHAREKTRADAKKFSTLF